MRDQYSPLFTADGVGLDSFFAARGVAVVGASNDRARVGGRVQFGLESGGYRGAIYPVHPNEVEVQGRACFASLLDVPDPIDLAIICLGAGRVPDAIRDCGRRGIAAAVVFADGFNEASQADLSSAMAEAQAASGLRMIGPNTVGIRTMKNGLFATFAADLGTPLVGGSIATIAQSGGLGVYFGSAQLMKRGYGASHVIDTGGERDVTAAECLEYLATQPEVSTIAMVLEGARDGRRLLEAVSKATLAGKTVVFLKTGRSVRGEEQIKSHTGALAGKAKLFESAMRAAGACVARDERELLDAMVIAGAGRVPKGRRIGVVTPSGGFGILVLDAAEDFFMELPEPQRPASASERAELAHGHFGNPLDFSSTISAGPNAVATSLTWMATQPNIDAVILWQAYGAVRDDRQELIYDAVSKATAATTTPIFVCGLTTSDFEERLRRTGVLWFEEPTRLVRALSVIAPPPSVPHPDSPTPEHGPATSARVIAGGDARQALAGLPGLVHVPSHTVESGEQAAAMLGSRRGILKVEAPGNAHKSEFGFVSVPVAAGGVVGAFAKLCKARHTAGLPDAPIVLQALESGIEMALGAFQDNTFGPAVMVATGGIFLETVEDAAFALAPLAKTEARSLILGLKGAALLRGARGRPSADIDALAEALVALSEFIANHPEYAQIDVNPILVKPDGEGAVAVDAVLYRSEEKVV